MARGNFRNYGCAGQSRAPLPICCPRCGYRFKSKEIQFPVCPRCRRVVPVRRNEKGTAWEKTKTWLQEFGELEINGQGRCKS